MNRSVAKASIQLHIDRLVVDAPLATHAGARALQEAIELELARLLTEEGLDAGPSAAGRGEPATLPFAGPAQPVRFGRDIARSIHNAIQLAQGTDFPQGQGLSPRRNATPAAPAGKRSGQSDSK